MHELIYSYKRVYQLRLTNYDQLRLTNYDQLRQPNRPLHYGVEGDTISLVKSTSIQAHQISRVVKDNKESGNLSHYHLMSLP